MFVETHGVRLLQKWNCGLQKCNCGLQKWNCSVQKRNCGGKRQLWRCLLFLILLYIYL